MNGCRGGISDALARAAAVQDYPEKLTAVAKKNL